MKLSCCFVSMRNRISGTKERLISFRRRIVEGFPNNSSLIAEALAIRKAVLEAFISNADSLLVLSDSQALVKLLKTKGSRTELNNILIDIYYYSSQLKACSIYYISRLCNVEADLVAKLELVSVNS